MQPTDEMRKNLPRSFVLFMDNHGYWALGILEQMLHAFLAGDCNGKAEFYSKLPEDQCRSIEEHAWKTSLKTPAH